MKIGTKSVLFGAHCFLWHWLFVARGWWMLYGFPLDPRLWFAFVLHDIGYLGKPNMDGPEGEQHPYTGARIMHALFDWGGSSEWYRFVLYHSRFLAKQNGQRPSRLCMADKMAICLTPRWLYLPFVRLTGEIHEYMAKSSAMNNTGNKYSGMNLDVSSQRAWYSDMQRYVRSWIEEHRDGREDTWTPNTKEAVTRSGVWR